MNMTSERGTEISDVTYLIIKALYARNTQFLVSSGAHRVWGLRDQNPTRNVFSHLIF